MVYSRKSRTSPDGAIAAAGRCFGHALHSDVGKSLKLQPAMPWRFLGCHSVLKQNVVHHRRVWSAL